MIGSIRGKVLEIYGLNVLIEAGGIGYEVFVPSLMIEKIQLNSEIFLYTEHVIREDSESLYGFLDKSSKFLFQELLKVNGIGPKSALAVLSTMSYEDFIGAVKISNISLITKVPGIGKKTAERLLIDIKDKIALLDSNNAICNNNNSSKSVDIMAINDAINALVSLGYKESLAASYVKEVAKDCTVAQEMIVKALALISKKR